MIKVIEEERGQEGLKEEWTDYYYSGVPRQSNTIQTETWGRGGNKGRMEMATK